MVLEGAALKQYCSVRGTAGAGTRLPSSQFYSSWRGGRYLSAVRGGGRPGSDSCTFLLPSGVSSPTPSHLLLACPALRNALVHSRRRWRHGLRCRARRRGGGRRCCVAKTSLLRLSASPSPRRAAQLLVHLTTPVQDTLIHTGGGDMQHHTMPCCLSVPSFIAMQPSLLPGPSYYQPCITHLPVSHASFILQ